MRDFIKNIMCLTHKQWLGQNPMKYHSTKGAIAIKTKEQLTRKLERLLDKDIHSIVEKDRGMLDLDPSDKAVMNMQEMQCVVFELKATKVQDKAVSKQNGWTNKILCGTLRDTQGLCPKKEYFWR